MSIQTLEYFASLGGAFVLLRPHQPGSVNGKLPLKQNWLRQPEPLAVAIAHAQHGGNVGLLTGHNRLIFLDLDGSYPVFCEQFGELGHSPTLVRADAPARAKITVRMTDEVPPSTRAVARRIELVSTGRHGVIYGRHPDGAWFELVNASQPLAQLSLAELKAVWRSWTGQPLRRRHRETRPRPIRCPPRSDGLVGRVKQAFPTCWEVLEHHGIRGPTLSEGGNTRVVPISGLLVKADDPRFFFCHPDQIGGDPIDLWGWLRYGPEWDRHNRRLFVRVLKEMAQVAGIERESRWMS